MKKIATICCYAVIISIIISMVGCKKSASNDDPIIIEPKLYRFNETLVVDGLTRTYTVNLPPNYYENTAFSLVIALHGGGGSAAQFESTCKLTDKANTAGFIVVYPDGTGNIKTFNGGKCCGTAVSNNVDDVKFISMLIDKLIANYKINAKKVYVTGHSNGGILCYRLACELANKIAAIAPNASSLVTNTACNPSRPMPVLNMHSKLDNNVPYMGGVGSGISNTYFPPIDSVLNVFSLKNSCANPSQTVFTNSGYTLKKWTPCTNNVGINFYLTNDGGHAWPGGLAGSASGDMPSTAINANDLLWDFFQQYQLP